MVFLWILAGLILLIVTGNFLLTVCNHVGSKLTVGDFLLGDSLNESIDGGLHGHRLKLRDIDSRRAVEFRKEIPTNALTRYYMTIRRSNFSADEFAAVSRELEDEGIEFTLKQPEDEQSEALIVNVGRDVELAERAARAVLLDAFGLTTESNIRVSYFGGLDVRRGQVHGWPEVEGMGESPSTGGPVPARALGRAVGKIFGGLIRRLMKRGSY